MHITGLNIVKYQFHIIYIYSFTYIFLLIKFIWRLQQKILIQQINDLNSVNRKKYFLNVELKKIILETSETAIKSIGKFTYSRGLHRKKFRTLQSTSSMSIFSRVLETITKYIPKLETIAINYSDNYMR